MKHNNLTNSVIKSFQVIEFLVLAKESRLSTISRQLGFPKSTVRRLLLTLASAGYVEQDPERLTYKASMKFVELGWKLVQNTEFMKIAHPFMDRLAEKTGETVNLGILDGIDVLCVDKVASKQVLRQDQPIGARAKSYCTAFGKALLAFLPEEEVAQLLANNPIERFTTKSLKTRKALEKELERIREVGYSVDNEDFLPGIRCAGAPIFDYRGKVLAGMSIAGPTVRITEKHIPELAKLVVEASAAVSRRLGFRSDGS